MKILAIIITILFLSCGGPEVKCKSEFRAGGLKVCAEGNVSAEEIEYLVQVTEQQAAERYPQVSDLKAKLREKKVHIFFIDDALSINCEELEHGVYRCEDHIGGANIDGDVIYVKYHSCLAYTSAGHELLHSIENYYLEGKMVEDHKTPWLFEQANIENYPETVEYQIFLELFMNVASCAEQRAKYGY